MGATGARAVMVSFGWPEIRWLTSQLGCRSLARCKRLQWFVRGFYLGWSPKSGGSRKRFLWERYYSPTLPPPLPTQRNRQKKTKYMSTLEKQDGEVNKQTTSFSNPQPALSINRKPLRHSRILCMRVECLSLLRQQQQLPSAFPSWQHLTLQAVMLSFKGLCSQKKKKKEKKNLKEIWLKPIGYKIDPPGSPSKEF